MKASDLGVVSPDTSDLNAVDKAIAVLMPDIADNQHDHHIKDIFKTLLGLVPHAFMDAEFDHLDIKPLHDNLHEMFLSYNRHISHPDYRFRAVYCKPLRC